MARSSSLRTSIGSKCRTTGFAFPSVLKPKVQSRRQQTLPPEARTSQTSLEQSNLIEHMGNVLAAYAGFGGYTRTLAAVCRSRTAECRTTMVV